MTGRCQSQREMGVRCPLTFHFYNVSKNAHRFQTRQEMHLSCCSLMTCIPANPGHPRDAFKRGHERRLAIPQWISLTLMLSKRRILLRTASQLGRRESVTQHRMARPHSKSSTYVKRNRSSNQLTNIRLRRCHQSYRTGSESKLPVKLKT